MIQKMQRKDYHIAISYYRQGGTPFGSGKRTDTVYGGAFKTQGAALLSATSQAAKLKETGFTNVRASVYNKSALVCRYEAL